MRTRAASSLRSTGPHDEIVDPQVEPADDAGPVGLLGDQQDRQGPGLLHGAHLRADAERIEIAERHADDGEFVSAAGDLHGRVLRIGQHVDGVIGRQMRTHPFGAARIGIDKQHMAAFGIGALHGAPGVLHGEILAGLGAGPQFVGQRLEAHQTFDARHQLDVVDGLGQEIVGAGLEPLHAVGGLVERGDHQHRDVRGGGIRP